MAQDDSNPDFRTRDARIESGISWLSNKSYQCPHFICSTCGHPITPAAPGIVIWRYTEADHSASSEYRIRHKTPACDAKWMRSIGGHLWYWNDLEEVLDQLAFNTLGRTPPKGARRSVRGDFA